MEVAEIQKNHNPELALIILCCRRFLLNSGDTAINDHLDRNRISWKRLYELSEVHRLRPIVYGQLAPFKDKIGAVYLGEFRDFSAYFSAFAMSNKRELMRLLQLLVDRNISAHTFKGIEFAEDIYGNISDREFSDNDIIISEADIPDVIKLMRAEGYHSKDTVFYKRFPLQYIRDYKDFNFEKRNGNIREFAVEFHFKPLRFFQDSKLSFADVLGSEYLTATKRYNATQHLQLMALNNGVMDFYPDLRSVLDLAMALKKKDKTEADKFDPLIRKYIDYGTYISVSLLLYPADHTYYELNTSELNFCKNMLQHILQMREGKRISASFYISNNIKIASSYTEKIKLLKNWLLLLLRPSEGDVEAIYLPNYFFYYFTKPFRLVLKSIQRKKL